MKKIKNKWLKALAILGIAVSAWSVFFTTDAIRSTSSKTPIFCIKVSDGPGYPDETYIGLFYIVYVNDYVEGCPLDNPPCEYTAYRVVEIHSWFYRG